ncbi:hypothetical protein LBWT_X4200 (plasmid) [Leptolyngbya boryana IAM M-101]|nr:hypothetical protein LBWT_X4200 [Leptolyngbya boryana IAM M-101]BAS66696.1 hypothetical protein LBDG_X4200 [Leptolyngbya boryana dg5]
MFAPINGDAYYEGLTEKRGDRVFPFNCLPPSMETSHFEQLPYISQQEYK